MNTATPKRKQLLSKVDECLDLVCNLTGRVGENRRKLTQLRSLRVDPEPLPITEENQQSLLRINSRLSNQFRLNFPINSADADFLIKELCVRLVAKKLQLGAVINLQGQLFESQIVQLMNRKLMYDNSYRLRKTVRYFFQITPFENERTRDRIELIDTVQEQISGYQSIMGLNSQERNIKFSEERKQGFLKLLMDNNVRYENYPLKVYMPLLEKMLEERQLILIMLKAIEDKRTITTMNMFDALEIAGITAVSCYEKKESSKTTHTDTHSTEDQFTLEDCQIECVPYQSVFCEKDK